jgi:molecular chaperone HtpG
MIALPSLFEEKLKKSPELESFVKQTFFAFEPWLRDSGMPFFPGFTDHSPVHIEEVLNTAASLVADDAHNLISASDVAVLCMAILLHDCGMHLTPDVFRKMVSSDDSVLIDGFGDQPWKTLWTDFLSEAGRFSQEKNHAIFGDSNPVNIADFDVENLSERDMLLVGEFVRRHHTRIAHEIGMFGVGIVEEEKIKLHGFDLEMRDMAGLIARSHGMYIRETFPYIEKKFGLVLSFREVKVPFLMALLRIADYIQVQSERAIKTLLSVKELKSPISRQEWMAHFAVRDVSNDHDDPEALYVHAMPKDVKGFLKLSNLFKDIQRELDVTWSTLGEVYGRHKTYKKLGLSLRRIRSNLDDVGNFSRNVSYIPVRARFDASGPDLLRLLVGPLYDYDYSVGVRELVQNAVDACRESLDIYQSSGITDEEICPSVRVTIEENMDGGGTISITDTGVGMTLKTVTNYFLIAGASFRNSDIWKQQHLDDSGASKITRGGRFGVGALAAFLLGDELKVQTRHITSCESDGIEFTARIDDSTVELRHCKAPVGTTIVVRIDNADVINSLRPFFADSLLEKTIETQVIENWSDIDWFAQREPAVEYYWNGFNSDFFVENPSAERRRVSGKYLRQEKKFIPGKTEDLTSNLSWRPLSEPLPYKAIFWEKPKNTNPDVGSNYWVDRGAVYVNGLFVENVDYKNDTLNSPDSRIILRTGYKIARPSLSIEWELMSF